MKHYISVDCGSTFGEAKKVELVEALTFLCQPQNASPTKENALLMFNGYSSTKDEYHRSESNLDRFSTLMIDCDNDEKNPNIIDEFKQAMKNYDYLLYETFSSTKEQPKFRAIIPLDSELVWSKKAKAAILHTFSKFADEKASWFYAPTLNRLNTIEDHDVGREFPARVIQNAIDKITQQEEVEEANRAFAQLKFGANKFAFNPEGWRNLKSVQKCLGGLVKGERDTELNRACYTMSKLGYKSSIPQFLDECFSAPPEMRTKFKLRYR